jgi:hypothetical protein
MGADEFDRGAVLRAEIAAAEELDQQNDRIAEALRQDLVVLSQNPDSWDSAVVKMKADGPKFGISDVVSTVDENGKPVFIGFVSAKKSKSLNCEAADDSWSCTLVKDETKSTRPMSSVIDKY